MRENAEESILIADARRGDLDAFNQLVLRYQGLLYNHACALLGDADEAEDVTQDAFIRAFQRINQFRGESFRAWLLRIATNACYDVIRSVRRHPTISLFPEDENGEEYESPAWVADPGPSVETLVERSAFTAQVYQALEELPLDYRTVLMLVDLHELDYAEAAQVLNIPIGTVRSRLARARLRLRHLLSPVIPMDRWSGSKSPLARSLEGSQEPRVQARGLP